MWFLIKGTFWFGLVLVLLSFFSGESSTKLANEPNLQISDAFVAATGAYDYLTGMCGEKPEVCVKGAETMSALGHRARDGARVAFDLLDSRFGEDTPANPTTAAASVPAAALAPSQFQVQAAAPARDEKTAALNQPMPYRPPVDDEASSDTVTTGAIPLPTPRPAT
ncbi:DUF5330 domain-containing protein [Rhizobium sp. Root1220]|uniref:DUF5330 domain-containing protein n=1 Tax=Rhizobium sp. Root1220 TaxID=1736432 RepID=UPI0006FE6778|nr:DUF5330 domain-containing protein [Rhizobium sp. Root1220]KQV63811.1 hypothetical protein ASC90_17705 [Rhizobium sp. Root1220]